MYLQRLLDINQILDNIMTGLFSYPKRHLKKLTQND